MTTIAIDKDGLVAWDDRITEGNRYKTSGDPKAIKTDRGAIFAAAGDHIDLYAYAEWWENGASEGTYPFDRGIEYRMLILTPHCNGYVYETNNTQRANAMRVNLPHAIGSGIDFALAAMYCGRDAAEAVHVAAQFDVCTSANVCSLRLREPVSDNDCPY